MPLALLRAAAWSAVGVLLVNPSCHRGAQDRTLVLLDGSASMSDAASDARWRAAVDTATAAAGAGGHIIVFGAEPHPFTRGDTPGAPTSLLLPALREAAARGDRIVIVTDGLVDDAAALPAGLVRTARVVVLARPDRPDAGIGGLDIPPILRAGDTAVATVDLSVEGAARGDSATLELREAGRPVRVTRIALTAGSSVRVQLPFVPAPARAPSEVRRYEARLSGFARDGEPRDNLGQTAAAVSQASAIALFSDSPDWDFKWLAQTLAAQSGVPVHSFVRLGATGWRDARTMRPVSEDAARAEAASAALVVAHGTEAGVGATRRLARRAILEWTSVPAAADGASAADWYVMAPEFASPVGGALAGVPAESLPPLESVLDLRPDSVVWTGLVAQVDRRGRSRPVVVGALRAGRRVVVLGGGGLWRWARRGGVSEQAYRALVASLTDWLLEEKSATPVGLALLRDSLAHGTGEFLPRRPSLGSQPARATVAVGESDPVRFSPWLYVVALGALVAEWVARRRRGLR